MSLGRNAWFLSCALLCSCSGGVSGDDGATTLVFVTDEAPGTNCADGGQRIDVGIDDSDDGVLDEAEIDSTAYVCNGATGDPGDPGDPGAATLVFVTEEAAGANCADGGQRIDAGVDDDADGVLDAEEIDETTYVCNGGGGLGSLIAVTDEAAGTNCADGGQRIDAGVDDDADGVLDAEEIDETTYVCNGGDGLGSLIAVTEEEPGSNCVAGGQRIDAGVDDDADGVLDAEEIDETVYVCHGEDAKTPARYLYLANWAGFNMHFAIYDIANDSWSAGADLPVFSVGQIASDGHDVWMYGNDNYFYEYDRVADSWTQRMTGPSLGTYCFFRILNGSFYLCESSTLTAHVYSAGSWSTIELPGTCSAAGGFDPANDEVYIKAYGNAGFYVIDAKTNTLARTITNATLISENTSSAAFLDDYFYTRSNSDHIFQLHGVSGAFADTGDDPGGSYPAFCEDPYAHLIYSYHSSSFQAYDPAAGTMTPLTTGPDQSTLGTCTLTY